MSNVKILSLIVFSLSRFVFLSFLCDILNSNLSRIGGIRSALSSSDRLFFFSRRSRSYSVSGRTPPACTALDLFSHLLSSPFLSVYWSTSFHTSHARGRAVRSISLPKSAFGECLPANADTFRAVPLRVLTFPSKKSWDEINGISKASCAFCRGKLKKF